MRIKDHSERVKKRSGKGRDEEKNGSKRFAPSHVVPSGILLEQCWDGNKAYFYELDGISGQASIKEVSEFTDLATGYTIYPLVEPLLVKGHITMPSKPMEYNDERGLFTDLQTHIHRWCEVSKYR